MESLQTCKLVGCFYKCYFKMDEYWCILLRKLNENASYLGFYATALESSLFLEDVFVFVSALIFVPSFVFTYLTKSNEVELHATAHD